MVSRLSVNVLLKTLIASLAAAIVILLAQDAWTSWTRLKSASRISAAVEASSLMFTSLHNLRFDRTLSYRELLADEQLSDASPQVKATRAAELAALKGAHAALSVVDFAKREDVLRTLASGTTRLARLQEEAAAAVRQPKAARRADLAQNYVDTISPLLDTLQTVSAQLTRQVKLEDPFVDALLDVKELAWGVRNVGGDIAVMIAFPLAGRPLPKDAMQKFSEAVGGLNSTWARMENGAAALPMPARFTELLNRTKRDLFASDYVTQRDTVMAKLLAGQPNTISSVDWTNNTTPRLNQVVELAEVTLDVAKEHMAAQYAAARWTLMSSVGLLAIAVVFAAAMMMVMSRRVTSPLGIIQAAMVKLANGDVTAHVPYSSRQDEIGALAHAMQQFKDGMIEADRLRSEQREAEQRTTAEREQAQARAMAERKAAEESQAKAQQNARHRLADEFQAAVGRIIDHVSAAAGELERSATTLTKTAETTLDLTGVVASASEEASSNVGAVASAAEELTGSVNEIARQVQESSRIAVEAVTQAKATDVRIGELSQAAGRIGDVLKLITAIAEQTNLLALNATIEAARAGEAGKGFAVVASEVKALAAQTAKATEEIASQISDMQMATADSVGAIKTIGTTISRISEIAAAVAAAVEEQGAATGEIARNVTEASRGTAQVANTIGDVNRGATATGSASTQVLSAARTLAGESKDLKSEVEKFLDTVRAA
jgi:methyl-accepting chemotaxis protein